MGGPGLRAAESAIKKAWHREDAHRALRANITQEILRIVTQYYHKTHETQVSSLAFQAEEILYSSANSKADYSDLRTLNGRLHDVVNNIIARDHKEDVNLKEEEEPPYVSDFLPEPRRKRTAWHGQSLWPKHWIM